MTFHLVTDGDDRLSIVSSDWNFDDPPYDSKDIEKHLERLMNSQNGIGFSAIQMGLPYRVFMMRTDHNTTRTFYNPKILDTGGEIVDKEGCLSFPNLFLNIKRPDSITVEYQDSTGNPVTEELKGIYARCYQHELDHLNGICFTDKVSKLALDIARRKRAKTERKK